MTISTAPTPLSYAGNGATTAFPITWKYNAKSHIVATLRASTGTETVWVLTTNYTLTNPGDTGTLTAVVAPATGQTLVITLEPPNTQSSDFPLGGDFPSTTVEDGLDLSAQRDAKIEALFLRALRVPKTDTKTGSALELPIDTTRASKFLAFDADGDPIAAVGTSANLGPVSTFVDTLLDDTTAGVFVETLRGNLSAETVTADDDEILLRDTSATTGKRMTFSNFIDRILTVARTFTAAHVHQGAETHSGAETHTGLESFDKTKFSTALGANYLNNAAFSASVSTNALTITLLGEDLATPSATNPVQVAFRSATLTTGGSTVRTATVATTVVAPSGATLGFIANEASYVYIYTIDNAGTIELAISGTPQDTFGRVTTIAIGAGSDAKATLYSTSARTDVALRYLGKILITTGATPGEWGTAPTSVHGVNETPPMWSIGYGQTWQLVTGSRSLGVQYVNSTGRPIAISVTVLPTNISGTVSMNVDGVTIGSISNAVSGTGTLMTLLGIVPASSTYIVNGSNLSAWAELR